MPPSKTVDRLPNLFRRSADALKVVLSPLSQSRGAGPTPVCSTFREEQLKLGEEIGRGAFAIVYRGRYLGEDVAVKVFNESTRSPGLSTQTALDVTVEIEKEANVIEQKRSKHIVRLLHYSTKKNWIVMEYCAHGSLYEVIRNESLMHIVLNLSERLRWMLEVALGMNVVHNEPPAVLHRDLRSPNILLDIHFVAKVGDFGLSKKPLSGLHALKSDSLGHTRKIWQPPEVMEGSKYSKDSDVYSFGVIMYEVLTLKLPFGFKSDDEFIDQKVEDYVKSGGKLIVPDDRSELPGTWHECLEKYIDLMDECTDHDPEKRPGFGEISNRLKEIKQEYDRGILCKKTKEHLVSISGSLKCCGIFALILCFTSLVAFSALHCHSETAFKNDGHEGPAKWMAFLLGLLGLFIVFLVLLFWCYKHARAQTKAGRKKHIGSIPLSLAPERFMNLPDSSSLITSPFENRNGLINGFCNSDLSTTVNLPIPAPEVWKDIREGFICELKGQDHDYLKSLARFCREHTNDELTLPQWENLIRIVHVETKVKETNTFKRFRDYLSVPMFLPEAPHLGRSKSMPVSGAEPSSSRGCILQRGITSSIKITSTGSVGPREEPELDASGMLYNSLPRSLSACSEVPSSQEVSSVAGEDI